MKSLKFLMGLMLLLVAGLTGGTMSYAKATSYQVLPDEVDVDPHHDWIINLNRELDKKTVNSNNVYVQLNYRNVKGVKVSLDADKKSIKIEAPKDGYIEGKSYNLYIKESVKPVAGEVFKKPMKMKFTVKVSVPDTITDLTFTDTDKDKDQIGGIVRFKAPTNATSFKVQVGDQTFTTKAERFTIVQNTPAVDEIKVTAVNNMGSSIATAIKVIDEYYDRDVIEETQNRLYRMCLESTSTSKAQCDSIFKR